MPMVIFERFRNRKILSVVSLTHQLVRVECSTVEVCLDLGEEER